MRILKVLGWLAVASATDSVLNGLQLLLSKNWSWIHLDGAAFATTFIIGAFVGRKYPGWWLP
jgi:hypothetical protein